MKITSSILIRALGILVGSMFVATNLLTANDRGLLSIDGLARLLGPIALGLVFIAYGIKGNALFAHPSPKLDLVMNLLLTALFVAMCLSLLANPDRGIAMKVIGCLLLLLGVSLSWVRYATRRSTPAA